MVKMVQYDDDDEHEENEPGYEGEFKPQQDETKQYEDVNGTTRQTACDAVQRNIWFDRTTAVNNRKLNNEMKVRERFSRTK